MWGKNEFHSAIGLPDPSSVDSRKPVSEVGPEELEHLRGLLIAARDEIAAALESGSAGVKPVELDEPIGRLSRMDAIQQQQMAKATRAALEIRRQQVAAALAAMESGSYGECRRCESPIELARLHAKPESPVCLECQQEIESR